MRASSVDERFGNLVLSVEKLSSEIGACRESSPRLNGIGLRRDRSSS